MYCVFASKNGLFCQGGHYGGEIGNQANVLTVQCSFLPQYHILPSKRPPPFFDDPMVRVYMQMDSPCKRPPRFLACEFQAPMGAYSGDYGKYNACCSVMDGDLLQPPPSLCFSWPKFCLQILVSGITKPPHHGSLTVSHTELLQKQ